VLRACVIGRVVVCWAPVSCSRCAQCECQVDDDGILVGVDLPCVETNTVILFVRQKARDVVRMRNAAGKRSKEGFCSWAPWTL
jgi:hypothetical protein